MGKVTARDARLDVRLTGREYDVLQEALDDYTARFSHHREEDQAVARGLQAMLTNALDQQYPSSAARAARP